MRHWRYSTVVAEFWLYGRKAVRGLKSLEARDFSRVRLHAEIEREKKMLAMWAIEVKHITGKEAIEIVREREENR
jgi:hypothetical protein